VIEPIRIRVEVECAPGHAFETYTRHASTWWPVAHTMSRTPGLAVVFEGRVGGRIFERAPGGVEHDWGEILAWEPPERLVYSWHIAADPADATEVEVVFRPVSEDRTEVLVEHRGWDRLGDRGRTWRRVNRAGWDGVLPDYVSACARVTEQAG
jgi:uncharacterized protein YndB with AHSA1/START domain